MGIRNTNRLRNKLLEFLMISMLILIVALLAEMFFIFVEQKISVGDMNNFQIEGDTL